jgi:hypothetical protein
LPSSSLIIPALTQGTERPEGGLEPVLVGLALGDGAGDVGVLKELSRLKGWGAQVHNQYNQDDAQLLVLLLLQPGSQLLPNPMV